MMWITNKVDSKRLDRESVPAQPSPTTANETASDGCPPPKRCGQGASSWNLLPSSICEAP
jgi:hypothetical protein